MPIVVEDPIYFNRDILCPKLSKLSLSDENLPEIIENNKNHKVEEALKAEEKKTEVITKKPTPKHVGIIPDGNRRWAKAQGIPAVKAHEMALEKLIPLMDELLDKTDSKILTIWGLSTENLARPPSEVDSLFNVVRQFVPKFLPSCHKYKCQIKRVGNLDKIPEDVLRLMSKAEKETEQYTERRVNVAVNYGGHWDIINAVNQFMKENPGQEATKEALSKYVCLANDEFPEPDLIVRTGCDSKCKRTSGFLTWQSSYTEFYFIDKMLPDVTFADFEEAMEAFGNTARRFGK